eukprot:6197013-Pleurochrysis_carterae.AAC.4
MPIAMCGSRSDRSVRALSAALFERLDLISEFWSPSIEKEEDFNGFAAASYLVCLYRTIFKLGKRERTSATSLNEAATCVILAYMGSLLTALRLNCRRAIGPDGRQGMPTHHASHV